jgi:hypothetical protein
VDPEAPYRQPRQLFENTGDGRFRDVSAAAGSEFTALNVGRGLAFGDWDNDGDVDLLATSNGGEAALFRNDAPAGRHWIGVRLTHPDGEARILGARVTVEAGGRRLRRYQRVAYSYAGANDPRLHFGLDAAAGAARVTVRWPGGGQTAAPAVAIDRYVTIGTAGVVYEARGGLAVRSTAATR